MKLSDYSITEEGAEILGLIVYTTNENLGSTLNRAKIEAVLTLNGVTLPILGDKKFHILDSHEKLFFVAYAKIIDTFYYEKASKAN
jgi:hypothetical protein